MTKMKPILFSTLMVKAILNGTKTMTRRVIKPQPVGDLWSCADAVEGTFSYIDSAKGCDYVIRPRYKVGDILYVRETWKFIQDEGLTSYSVIFKDGTKNDCLFDDLERIDKWDKYIYKNGWQSPYYMPREAARLFLRVTDVRAEKLGKITEADALAEGFAPTNAKYGGCLGISTLGTLTPAKCPKDCNCLNARENFVGLCDKINSKRPGCKWADNPYVWVYSFERIEKNGQE